MSYDKRSPYREGSTAHCYTIYEFMLIRCQLISPPLTCRIRKFVENWKKLKIKKRESAVKANISTTNLVLRSPNTSRDGGMDEKISPFPLIIRRD